MADDQVRIHHDEGSPWFWKLFGSAIIAAITILVVSHITSINANIDRSSLNLKGEIKDISNILDSQRERLIGLEQQRTQNQERIETLQKTLAQYQISLEESRSRLVTSETQIVALKEEVKTMREWCIESTRQLQDIREKLAAAEGAKKSSEPLPKTE